MIKESCTICRFSNPDEYGILFCRRKPPALIDISLWLSEKGTLKDHHNNETTSSQFPSVAGNGWCGEFSVIQKMGAAIKKNISPSNPAINVATANIMRLREVMLKTGHRSNASIYTQIKAGTFPKSLPIGPRAVGWPSTEVDDIIKARTRRASIDDIKKLVTDLHRKRNLGDAAS